MKIANPDSVGVKSTNPHFFRKFWRRFSLLVINEIFLWSYSDCSEKEISSRLFWNRILISLIIIIIHVESAIFKTFLFITRLLKQWLDAKWLFSVYFRHTSAKKFDPNGQKRDGSWLILWKSKFWQVQGKNINTAGKITSFFYNFGSFWYITSQFWGSKRFS